MNTFHHITDWKLVSGPGEFHSHCKLGSPCKIGQDGTCPMMLLLATYRSIGLWDACDPKHRACIPGNPCTQTEDKFCSRIVFLVKLQHMYGTCGAGNTGLACCPSISEEERCWLFPSCPPCGVLTEIRALVLIHRRILDECVPEERFSRTDIRHLENGLAGYLRAYEVRRGMHIDELRNQTEDTYRIEMQYARGVDDYDLTVGKHLRQTWLQAVWLRVTTMVADRFGFKYEHSCA
ncbi:hypothetical protein GQ607_017262 [Colletotrichum asianum]|uniref:Uncharacterized protein n=1 Tax=Colletotrichum asianum TaxID=702518 RepID=A0A8H3VXF4_9PEZI|nr:hypothetical protein GQ607_017262 [Colletotrichum asianum]